MSIAGGLVILLTTLLMLRFTEDPKPTVSHTASASPSTGDEPSPAVDEEAESTGSSVDEESESTGSASVDEEATTTTHGLTTEPDSNDGEFNDPKPELGSSSPPSRPKQPKAKGPLTDDTARTRLSRSLRKKCRPFGKGSQVSVSLVVGSDGRVLTKSAPGTSGQLEQCLLDETAKARFPAGTTRRLTIQVSL